MENRNIEDPKEIASRKARDYHENLMGLKSEALLMANELLSKPPEYWGANHDKALEFYQGLEQIKSSGHSLDADLDTLFTSSNE